MNELRKAAQQAMEALKNTVEHLPVHFDDHFEAFEALRAALAQERSDVQPEPEPVAWMTSEGDVYRAGDKSLEFCGWTPLYPAPPHRQPLTGEQLREILRKCPEDTVKALIVTWNSATTFARAIEAAHGIGGEK